MAQSRLERIGTIFSRVTSLMKGGALKPENQPLWYIIYKAFPPKQEPRFDRVAPNIEIKEILYKEDIIRAKFQNDNKSLVTNLSKDDRQSTTQKFITIYQDFEKNGIPESEIYERSVEQFEKQHYSLRRNSHTSSAQSSQPSSSSSSSTAEKSNPQNLYIRDIFEK